MSTNHAPTQSPDGPLHSPSSPASSLHSRPQYRRQDASSASKRNDSSPVASPILASAEENAVLLKQLKEAVLTQQRMPATSPAGAASIHPKSIKRIPSIKEEEAIATIGQSSPTMSPTLSAAFESPLLTASTESTESARTVRGSALPTPAAVGSRALMTPSYPFPIIPGTPQWDAAQRRSFHGSTLHQVTSNTTSRQHSEPSTPVPFGSGNFFAPGTGSSGPEQYGEVPEGPNLYDLVLMLNMDPGLHAWWKGVVKIFTDYFGTERLSLALPADAGEVENVPWGQKATYNKSGLPAINSSMKPKEDDSVKSKLTGHSPSKSGLEPARPQLASRHSYAGTDSQRGGLRRPGGLMRMRTFANPMQPDSEPVGLLSPLPTLSSRTFSVSDSEFSTMPSQATDGPYSAVLSVLRALNFEADALLEAASVNKILERAGMVVLTRDYSDTKPEESDTIESSDSGKSSSFFYSKMKQPEHFVPKIQGAYEEYEQVASSPWAQSPAPSPAVQADPETNPFFAESNVDDDAFNPEEEESQDYHSSVEAIGVDRANTIIHIPLVHPRSSSRFPFKGDQGMPGLFSGGEVGGRSSPLKKVPIAILSLSAPVVPYPPHLIKSLQLLMPHLATSFDIAQQYTSLFTQNEAQFRQRNSGPGERRGTLGDLDEAEIDISNDSMTSPSEYSGRSRQSPGGSTGTPGWDTGNFGLSNANVIPSTPGVQSASEMIESYFDSKKKSDIPLQAQSSTASSTVFAGNKIETAKENVDSERNPLAKQSISSKPLLRDEGNAMTETAGIATRRPHSFLHSYGADFKSTFHTLPAGASPLNAPINAPKLPEDTSGLSRLFEIAEMPPPSEKLLRTIVDSLPVQIFTAAPQTGELTWVNSKFIVYRGQPSQYVLHNSWNAVHPEDTEQYLDEWKRSLQTGQPFSQKARLLRFDGEYRWFYVRATPLKNKRGQIVHWTGTCMDVHEQYIAEVNAARQKETEASEAKYRSLANSSPQIVFAIEPSRGLTFCNSQWLRYSGQTDEEAAGLGFLDYVHPEDISRCRLPVPKFFGDPSPGANKLTSEESSESGTTVTNETLMPEAEKDPEQRMSDLANQGVLKIIRDQGGIPSYSTEVRLRSKDNEYHWHLIRVLKAEGPGPETWYGTCTDINDLKTLENTLKLTTEAKTRFLSNMSHEIRTPLNGILGMVNFLLDTPLIPEAMSYVNIIRNSTEGLRDLINDILLFSKVEANMLTLNHNWMDIRKVIEETNDLMFALAFDKGLELNYSIDQRVPPLIKGDQFRIRQILINLVGNAIKFTQTGEVFVSCMVDDSAANVKENERMIKFEVVDTGKGFTDEEADTLFTRFTQLSESKPTGGTGLGLAISMALVELHGGKMTTKGVPNKGATFIFTLKCGVPTQEDGKIVLEPIEQPAVVIEGRPTVTATSSQNSVSSSSLAVSSPSSVNEISTIASSGSSDPNINLATNATSIRSERSSMSSMLSDLHAKTDPIPLELPNRIKERTKTASDDSVETVRPFANLKAPKMLSVLVISGLDHARDAIVNHLEKSIPKTTPHHITTRSTVDECHDLLVGANAITFTHVVIDVKDVPQTIRLLDLIVGSSMSNKPSIVIITDVKEKLELTQTTESKYNLDALKNSGTIDFIFKPLKASKFAAMIDPKGASSAAESDLTSVQAVATVQRNAFNMLQSKYGDKGLKVLLLEDNRVNQQVLIRYLKRIHVDYEVVENGQQGLDKFLANRPENYILILCDLEMPVKDGYDTCRDIRKWERENNQPHIPIIALSANVLGDVYSKCVEAGFSSYVTKPVDFQEIGNVLDKFLDKQNPAREEFLKMQ